MNLQIDTTIGHRVYCLAVSTIKEVTNGKWARVRVQLRDKCFGLRLDSGNWHTSHLILARRELFAA